MDRAVIAACALLGACSSGPHGRAADGSAGPDAAIRADAAPRDAQPPDVGRPPDAVVADSTPVPVVMDAAADAARPPVPFPPPGNAEPCNYADDDGDGLVDEGVAYRIRGRPAVIADVADDRGFVDAQVAWTGRGFAVAWVDTHAWIAFTDADGAPVAAPRRLSPPGGGVVRGSLALAATARRVAVVYTRDPTPSSFVNLVSGAVDDAVGNETYVHLLDLDGADVAPPRVLAPDRRDAGANAVAAAGDGFGVAREVASGVDPGAIAFELVGPDAAVRTAPVDVVPDDVARSPGALQGMDWDGERFALVWRRPDDALAFARWAPDGAVVDPPTVIGLPATQFSGTAPQVDGRGLVWTGSRHVLPLNQESRPSVREDPEVPCLAWLEPDGMLPPDGLLATAPVGDLRQIAWTGDQLVVSGSFALRAGLRRLGPHGEPVGPPAPVAAGIARLGSRPGGPLPLLQLGDGPDARLHPLELALWGCP